MGKDILDYLESVGVSFDIFMHGGSRMISAEMARSFAAQGFNRDQVHACLHGVPLETYYKWLKWEDDGCPCQAKTVSGRPCKIPSRHGSYLGPDEFERDGFCAVHWSTLNE